MSDLRDPSAYRIALGLLGLALAALLLGIAWVATVHDTVEVFVAKDPPHMLKETQLKFEVGQVPVELWFAAGVLGGLFVGVLIPFSTHVRSSCSSAAENLSKWVWGIVSVALLLAAVGATLPAFKFADDFSGLCVLAVTIATALLGLLIPSPAGRVGRGGS